ncbi:MAG TPA: zinc ribbon domain-containing protein [Candidatus Nanopelagicales bacterium]|nr:zinc ribbon domain-containing protein [Candidatus Nanopelagicales bacterium]
MAELRIVDEELWNAVQARAEEKKRFGRERVSGARPRYLLSGFSRCGACGGRIQVVNGKATIKVYVCANHRERGTCANAMRRPVEEVDAAVLGWIQEHVLDEEVIGKVMREVRRRLAVRVATEGRGGRSCSSAQINCAGRSGGWARRSSQPGKPRMVWCG